MAEFVGSGGGSGEPSKLGRGGDSEGARLEMKGDGEEETHPMDFRGVLSSCGLVAGEPPEPGREAEATGVSRASWLCPCKQREMKGKEDKMKSEKFNLYRLF